MQRVKLLVALLAHDAFRRLCSDARHTMHAALALAEKLGHDGDLTIAGVGPMTVREIASYTGLSTRRQARALDELLATPLLGIREGAYSVAQFVEAAFAEFERDRARERSRRHRDRVTEASRNRHEKNVTGVTESSQIKRDGVTQTSRKKRDAPPHISEYRDPADPPVRTSFSPPDRAPVTQTSRKKRDETVTEWVEPMRAAVRDILDVLVPNLTLDQRLLLGQFAAWKWANCTQDLRKNQRKARQFASHLESIGAKKRFEQMPVREFVGAGNRLWAHPANDKAPIHNLWHVLSAIERGESAIGKAS